MSAETVGEACGGTWRTCSEPRALQCDKCGMYGYGAVQLATHDERPGFRGNVENVWINGQLVVKETP